MSGSPALTVRPGDDPKLVEMLKSHPRVCIAGASTSAALEMQAGEWRREIRVGSQQASLFGLVELMDNNPLVCADSFSLPSPAGTLALIAFGPLIRAGILVEPPVAMISFEDSQDEVSAALGSMGWTQGATLSGSTLDLGTSLAANCIAVIQTPEDPSELDSLYNEDFGRSFYIRRDETSDWDTQLVSGKPYALYRLRFTPGEDHSLITIQVMADRDGKCGAAQVVHAMNVMSGFEESLGISS